MYSRSFCSPYKLVLLLVAPAVLTMVLSITGAIAAVLPSPTVSGWSVWSADQAQQVSVWQTGNESGFLQPTEAGARLDFPFEMDRYGVLRVRPVWWRTGEQKLASRFPAPMPAKPGPDAVDYIGSTVFTTAPATGRVIAVDIATEAIIGVTEVGGYLTDLAADRDHGRVYAADALGDRVVAIDAKTGKILSSTPVASAPWSLAYHDGTLYVACRDAHVLLALDAMSGRKIEAVSLPASPISLELVFEPSVRLLVRFLPQAFDVFSLDAAPIEFEQVPSDYPCGGGACGCDRYEISGPHTLTHITDSGKARTPVDVSSVTGGEPAEDASRFGSDPGPVIISRTASGLPVAGDLTYFTAPRMGRIGTIDRKTGKIDFIQVGGYPTDMIPDGDNLYIADPMHDRIIMIDIKTAKVSGEIDVAGEPWRLAIVGQVAWQRQYEDIWPTTKVNRIYAACRKSGDLAMIDIAKKTVLKRTPLAGAFRDIRFLPMPNPDWWPVMADNQIAIRSTPRVAVETHPVVVELPTLKGSLAVADTAAVPANQNSVNISVGGAPVKVSANNELALRIGDDRWIDLSSAADPQRQPNAPLTGKDKQGSITVSVDDGPEFDWAEGIWITPDNEMLLATGSQAFWRYNALRFAVEPGKHVLHVTARSQFPRLEGMAVQRSPEPQLDVTVVPEPQDIHGKAPLASYQGVFYDKEPVRFTLRVTNNTQAPTRISASCTLLNYLGKSVKVPNPGARKIDAGQTLSLPLDFHPADMGRFKLSVSVASQDGDIVKDLRFLRLPKLEHPRIFFRKEDIPAIQARIANYPLLFNRYADWVERMNQKEGRFPELFLPSAPTAEACAAAAPEGSKDPGNECAWRNYEVGWRILASEFALAFLKPDSGLLKQKVTGLRGSDRVDEYCQFHHHGPFFPGVDASLIDLSPDPQQEAPKIQKQMADKVGDMNVLPWTLVSLEEPLTPQKRALIYEIMTLENNAEQYFETHSGARGGTWWQNPYTWCHCPMHGYMLMFMFLHNVFGEPQLFEKPVFAGYLTFQRYAEPLNDFMALQPKRNNPGGEPWRWIFNSLTKHPLEKSNYQWDAWLQKMNGPLAGDEQAAVDKLMALEGISQKGPMQGHTNYFVSAVSVPVALALGWYDPATPVARWKDFPTTALFDVEGWAVMRSGADSNATEVTLVSGVRDHTTRHKPNHLTVIQGGRYLLGTPSLLEDDGFNTSAWGNSVVVDDDWQQQWALNLQHPRDGEHLVINRFSQAGFDYIARDRQLVGYKPAEDGWGGGLDLHGHTETLFMKEGNLLGYQTWPELDYAAGDAANAWPVDKVTSIDRQVVYAKPDLVVVYDRVVLGPAGKTSKWIATTAPELSILGDTFTAKNGAETLTGRVLLPEETAIESAPTPIAWMWKEQKLLQVSPVRQDGTTEYLVVMRVGEGLADLPAAQLIHTDTEAGVKLTVDGRELEVRFNRNGAVGGTAMLSEKQFHLQNKIVDNYDNWRSDPRYQTWMSEPVGRFVK